MFPHVGWRSHREYDSVVGVVADANMSPYLAAKHAVVGLTNAAALKYGRQNIRGTAIASGFLATLQLTLFR